MNNIDLHIHTNYSDGTFTPKEIVDLAKKNNMKVLSFTDHDTIKGVKEGIEYAKKFGIKVIPGVELSTFSVMEIHILGYNFDINNTKLIETLEDFSQQREERVLKILNELKEAGDPVKDIETKTEYLKAYNQRNWSVCWRIIMREFNLERANFED